MKQNSRKSSFPEKVEKEMQTSPPETAAALSEEELRGIVHKLQAYQIELQLQNEELNQAREERDASRDMYRELYDFAPVGYLTLDHHGVIRKSNLAGAALIGMERPELINREFALFISQGDRSLFKTFLRQVFVNTANEACELDILKSGGEKTPVAVNATASKNAKECNLVLTDLSRWKKAEEALARNEAGYRNLFENTSIGMFQSTFDPGRYLQANAAYARMLGYESPEELMYTVTDIATIHVNPQDRAGLLDALRQRDWYYAEYPRFRKDGGVMIGKVAIRRILKPDGTIDFIEGIVEDVTDQRRGEEERKKYVEEVQDLYENAPCGYHSLGPDGTILQMNATELAWLGYTRDEMIGKKFTDLLPPEEKEVFWRTFPLLQKQGKMSNIEGEIIRKDGTILPIILNATAVYDEEGHFRMGRTSVFDNAERKRAEDALEENEALYRNLFENASIGMFQTTLEGKFLRVNKALAAMAGYESSEEAISTVDDISTQIHADPRNRAELLAVLEQQDWFYAEQPYIRKDGSILIGQLAIRKVVKADGITAYLEGIVEDITERKQAEEALRKSEKELRLKAQNLMEVNTTLKVLMDTMEKDQEELQERFLANIKEQVLPYLEKLKKRPLPEVERGLVQMAEKNLNEVASPFVQKLASSYLNLTKKEIQIAMLVKEGKTSKEIADILNASKRVVEFHRENIRRKLGLTNKKGNLEVILRSFS